jgi:hypothetical protein
MSSYTPNAYIFKNQVVITDTTVATRSTGSFLIEGGSKINKNLFVDGDESVAGQMMVNNVNITPNLNDIIFEQQATLSSDVTQFTDIVGFRFLNSIANSFKAIISVSVTGPVNYFSIWDMVGVYSPDGWSYTSSFTGDLTGVEFGVRDDNGKAQVQYKNSNGPQSNTVIRYRASTTAPPGTSPVGGDGLINTTSNNYITNTLLYANTSDTVASAGDITYTSGKLDLGGVKLNIPNTTDFTNSTTATLIVGGGASIGKKLYVGTQLGIATTTPAFNLDVKGDINFTGNFYRNGTLYSSTGLVYDNQTNSYFLAETTANLSVGKTAPANNTLDVSGGITSLSITTGPLVSTSITTGGLVNTFISSGSAIITTISSNTIYVPTITSSNISVSEFVYATNFSGANIQISDSISANNFVGSTVTASNIGASSTVYASTFTGSNAQLSGAISAATLVGSTVTASNIGASGTVSAANFIGTKFRLENESHGLNYVASVDGPVLYGWDGGALAYNGSATGGNSLVWTRSGITTANIYASSAITVGTIIASTVTAANIGASSTIYASTFTGANVQLSETISAATHVGTTMSASNMYSSVMSAANIGASSTIYASTFTGANAQLSGTISAATHVGTTMSASNLYAGALTVTQGNIRRIDMDTTGYAYGGIWINGSWILSSGVTAGYIMGGGNTLWTSDTSYNFIVANALKASSVTTGSVQVSGTISAATLVGTTMTASNMYASTMSAANIGASGTISAATLVGTTMSAANIGASGTISAATLVGTTMSAANMYSSVVSASNIGASNSVTTGVINLTNFDRGVNFGANIGNKQISLADLASNFFGIGANNSAIQYQAGTNSAHRFYTNASQGSSTAALGTLIAQINSSGISSSNAQLSGTISAATLVGTTMSAANMYSSVMSASNIGASGTIYASTFSGSNAQLSGTISAATLVSGTLNSTNANATNAVITNISAGNITASNIYVSGSVVSVNVTSLNLIENNISTGVLIVSGTTNLQGATNTIGNIFMTGGNVGIDVKTPGYKLDVDGMIGGWGFTGGNIHLSSTVSAATHVGTTMSASNMYSSVMSASNIGASSTVYASTFTGANAQLSGTISAATHVGTTMSAANMYSSVMSASNIGASVISAGTMIAAPSASITSVNATGITAGTIIAATITAGTVTAANIGATTIYATTLTGSNVQLSGTMSSANISTSYITSGQLNMKGEVALNDNTLNLGIFGQRAVGMAYHGDATVNGPMLYGYAGGALAYTSSGVTIASLKWNSGGISTSNVQMNGTISAATLVGTTMSAANMYSSLVSASNIGASGTISAGTMIAAPSATITNINSSSGITAGTIIAATITAGTVTAANIGATTIYATTFTGANAQLSGTISAATHVGTTMSASNLYSSALTATQGNFRRIDMESTGYGSGGIWMNGSWILSSGVTAGYVMAGGNTLWTSDTSYNFIVANALKASSVTTGSVQVSGTISAATHVGTTMSAANIYSSVMSAANIGASGSISAGTMIAAPSATITNINASSGITAGTIVAATITAGTVTAANIGAPTISAATLRAGLGNNPLYISTNNDSNHVLQYIGGNIDGPMLKGNLGGILAYNTGGQTPALSWVYNVAGPRVGIATTTPGYTLDVNGWIGGFGFTGGNIQVTNTVSAATHVGTTMSASNMYASTMSAANIGASSTIFANAFTGSNAQLSGTISAGTHVGSTMSAGNVYAGNVKSAAGTLGPFIMLQHGFVDATVGNYSAYDAVNTVLFTESGNPGTMSAIGFSNGFGQLSDGSNENMSWNYARLVIRGCSLNTGDSSATVTLLPTLINSSTGDVTTQGSFTVTDNGSNKGYTTWISPWFSTTTLSTIQSLGVKVHALSVSGTSNTSGNVRIGSTYLQFKG